MKVCYEKFWNEGTCYSQIITVTMDEDDIIHMNRKLYDIKNSLKYGQVVDGHCMVPENIKWLDYGYNFLTITEFVILKRLFGWDENPRVMDGRNTMFRIKWPQEGRKKTILPIK